MSDSPAIEPYEKISTDLELTTEAVSDDELDQVAGGHGFAATLTANAAAAARAAAQQAQYTRSCHAQKA